MTIAEEWAEFVLGVEYKALPEAVVHRIKRSLVDALGVAVLGSRNDACRMLVSWIKSQGATPEATIIGDGTRTTAANAAFANASFMHSTELWEVFLRARTQPGAVVTAAALAVAEKMGASGRELLAALVVGYEISIRAALAVDTDPASATFSAKDPERPDAQDGPRGFHMLGATFGVYGATAAAAKLLHLDRRAAAHALGLCSAVTPAIGLEPPVRSEPAMPKDLYLGFASHMGVIATELAARGFEGRRDVTSHFASLSDYAPELLTRGLGSDWLVDSGGLVFKLHAAAGMALPAVYALLRLREREPFQADDVDQLDVHVSLRGARRNADTHPANPIAAKASIPYVLSAVLTFGDVRNDPRLTELYNAETFRDPRRRRLAERVRVHAHDRFTRGQEHDWPARFEARVEVKLRSGQMLSEEVDVYPEGAQMSDEGVATKFRDVAGRVLPADRVEDALERILRVDRSTTVSELLQAVRY
jgi:2-methylcitrate dehydratase PrpD